MSVNKKSPVAKKAAMLVENGFCERELIQAESVLKKMAVDTRIISVMTPLVKSWREEKQKSESNWSEKYAADNYLSKAIPTDYDILVIPGGVRSIDKLRQANELKSFISGFLDTGKPTIIYNQAVDLLMYYQMANGYSIAAKDKICDKLSTVGGRCASKNLVVSKNLITLSRYRDIDEKLMHAISSVLNNETYIEKIVSSDTLPKSHQAA